MSLAKRSPRFVERHLDPASGLGEVVFGLIMVLTVTLGAGVAAQQSGGEPLSARALLAAAIGCNIAWGIIDGVLYMLNASFERRREAKLRADVARTQDDSEALRRIGEELDPMLVSLATPAEQARLTQAVLDRMREPSEQAATPPLVTRADLLGAVAAFWLVVMSCIPAIVPFLLISDPRFALRVSNFSLVGMLFIVGWIWARYTGGNRLIAGLSLVGLGVALVLVAMALGG